jgi:predicted aldo/keto reductase-like oxidoreductase
MSSVEEVQENLTLAEEALEGDLSIRDEVLVSRVRDAYRSRRPINCDTCRACMPCHNGVDPPRIFELFNDAFMYGDLDIPRRLYRLEGHDISLCDECGSCARACGRSIAIPERIREADKLLGNQGS